VDDGLAADDEVLADRDSLSTNEQLVFITEAMQSSHCIKNLISGGKRIASPSSFRIQDERIRGRTLGSAMNLQRTIISIVASVRKLATVFCFERL
jgi:hypothetical protein